MIISNFEQSISGLIVERGRRYFKEGRYKLMHRGGGQYVYQVYGTKSYTTQIVLKGEEIDSCTCNCPYDMGPICKHIVCVLFDLNENIQEDSHIQFISVDELVNSFSENVLRMELKKLLDLNPEYHQKLLLKYGYFKAENIKELVSRAFYAADIDYDDYDYCELDDFSDILIDAVKKIEKSYSLAEMILIAKDIEEETEKLFLSIYGFSEYLYENDSYYFPEFAESYLDEYVDKKCVDGIEMIVDSYLDDFIDSADYNENKIPMHILYSLMRFSYNEYTVNKIDEIVNDIKENAMNLESFTSHDFIRLPPKEYLTYKRKAIKQNRVLLNLDHFLYGYAIKNQDDKLVEDIVNTNFLIDFYFFEKKIASLMCQQKYNDVEVLLNGDFKHHLSISRVEEMKEELYIKLNRHDDLRKIYLVNLSRSFSKETYLKLKKLSNDVELKRLLRTQVDKCLNHDYIPNDLIDILLVENLKEYILELVENNNPLVSIYYELISDRYQDQLNVIYKQYLYDFAESANKRSQYERVCHEIERYRKLTGLETDSFINELRLIYKKRPAMVDELNKIGNENLSGLKNKTKYHTF